VITIFLPTNKWEGKTSIRGLWRNEKGKIYYDYLRTVDYGAEDKDLYNYIEELKTTYNQEAIFYVDSNKLHGFVFYSKYNIEVLTKVKYIACRKAELKKTIINLLKEYEGITIYHYRRGGDYLLRVFYK
jgi:hypothetical protein